MDTATAAAVPLITQHLAFPARSRSRAEAGPSAVSCAEIVFNAAIVGKSVTALPNPATFAALATVGQVVEQAPGSNVVIGLWR